MVEIPAFLCSFDKFVEAFSTNSIPYRQIESTQKMLWGWLTNIELSLHQWKVSWVDSDPRREIKEVDRQGDDPFPVFQYQDPTTLEIVTPTTLVFPDIRLANTMCLYHSALLILATTDTRPTDPISPQEQHQYACNICRSIEYYIRSCPGNLINRLAFPMRVAFDAFPEGSVERRYVHEIFQLVQDRFKLRLWGSKIPEISPRRRLLA